MEYRIPNNMGELSSMAWQNKDNERLIEIIREMFAEERQLISGNTVSLATQSSRLEQLNMQISTVVNQQESMRADFNTRWGDLPKIYIPRQEVLEWGMRADYQISKILNAKCKLTH